VCRIFYFLSTNKFMEFLFSTEAYTQGEGWLVRGRMFQGKGGGGWGHVVH